MIKNDLIIDTNFQEIIDLLKLDINDIILILFKENNSYKLASSEILSSNNISNFSFKRITLYQLLSNKNFPYGIISNKIDNYFQEDIITLTDIIDSFEDRELSNTIFSLIALKKITPGDQDYDKINKSISDLDSLRSLVYEYKQFEDDIYDEISQSSYNNITNKYDKAISKEIERIITELKEVKEKTISSELAINIYKIYAESICIEIIEDIYFIQIGEFEKLRPKIDHLDKDALSEEVKNYEIAVAIFLSFHNSDALYYDQVLALPKWAINLIDFKINGVIKSKLYNKNNLAEEVFTTALSLYKDGGVYNSFDQAVITAKALVK